MEKMEENAYHLVEDFCKRNNLPMSEFIDGRSIKELEEIAGQEYAQQQCEDNQTMQGK